MVGMWDFVGREAELSAIRRAAGEVAATGSPRFVLIEGPAGVGKTALLNEAIKYIESWWRANVYLDVGDRFRPGYGATHLLRKPQRYNAPSDPGELQAWVQATADAISDPIVVVMEDLQWIDEMSAGIIFDVIREIEDVPMFNLVTMQTNNRECVTRFSRLAETVGEATHFVLEPFSVEEVGRHLSTITGMPISERVAEDVHGRTDGFPEFVSALGRSLGSSTDELGRRLPAAFRELELESGPAGSHRRVVQGLLQECSDDVQRMLLLSCAHRSLSAAEIGRALHLEAVDVEALRRTNLVTENTISGRYSISYGIVQRAILANYSRQARADLHRQLALGESGESAARHRSQAAVLDPSAEPPEGLVDDVLESAALASTMGDRVSALELARLAFDVERNEATLEAFAFAALRARKLFTLADSKDWIRDATRGSLRRALEAHDALQRGNFEAGLALLSHTGYLHQASTITVLIYAEAVVQLARLLSLRGTYQRVATLVTEMSQILASMSGRVFAPGQNAGMTSPGAATPEHVRCEFVSIRSLLSLWSIIEDRTLRRTEADERIDELLRNLERFPETELARAEILTGKGSRRRISGDRVGSQESYLTSMANRQDRDPSVPAYAQLNLCLLYFDAAMWTEAHRCAMSAAASVLAVREEQLGAIAYSFSRLVPAARGRIEEVTWHEERLTAAAHQALPLGEGSRLLVQAWSAIAERDHRSVVNHLVKLSSVSTVWSQTVQMGALLGRAFFYSGRGSAIGGLRNDIEVLPVEDTLCQQYVVAHLKGLQDQAESSPLSAMAHYVKALDIISSEPGFNRTDIPGDGGTLRIYRALLALDIGYLVATHRDALQDYQSTAQGLLAWAASTFEACESEGLFQQADHLFIALQHNETPQHAVEQGDDLMSLPTDVSSEARYALASLTGREREISLLVGQGLTNKQVAERLVISVRTVEYHVANVLGKLQLSSRHDLRRLLLEDAEPSSN